jgi:hypothetical protein
MIEIELPENIDDVGNDYDNNNTYDSTYDDIRENEDIDINNPEIYIPVYNADEFSFNYMPSLSENVANPVANSNKNKNKNKNKKNAQSFAKISDVRIASDFRGISFSEFQKGRVVKQLMESLDKSAIEPACYWCAELICAGHFIDIWECVFTFYGKCVHITNVRASMYMSLRLNAFKSMMLDELQGGDLAGRNSLNIRTMFGELICVLCLSKRSYNLDYIRVPSSDFDITNLPNKLKAPNLQYGELIITQDDPRELFIAINELAYHVSRDSFHLFYAQYWVEWVLGYQTILKKRKMVKKCGPRGFAYVEPKHQCDIVWVVWDVFLKESVLRGGTYEKIISSLVNLFSLRYTISCFSKRKHLLYLAAAILCDPAFTLNDEIVSTAQKPIVSNVLEKINIIYKQIKKNEISPQTSEISNSKELTHSQKNKNKTNSQLDIINEFNNSFVPRIDD